MSMDVSEQKPKVGGLIDQVGLRNVKMPVWVKPPSSGASHPGEAKETLATVTASVSLDRENQRGVHMSRLYLTLHEFLGKNPLQIKVLQPLLEQLVKSQKGLSKKAFVKIEWNLQVERPALLTPSLKGWRSYPVFYEGYLRGPGICDFIMGVQITYSSTCPCSASLSRGIIQKKFQEDFSSQPSSGLYKKKIAEWLKKESSLAATPHAQKSEARLRLKVKPALRHFLPVIDEVEKALGTPVQTAVKKEDEGEFARLNATHLMFSEDAARTIKSLLNGKPWIKDFEIEVRHLESLHPFDVSCRLTKQIPGGWQV